MNRLLRLYNQNRRIFWQIIGVIIIIYLIIQSLDNYLGKAKNNTTNNNAVTIYNNKNYAVITEDIIEEQSNEIEETLKSFLNNCNTGKIENAYNMLSKDCIENVFKTQEEFIEKYYNIYFKNKKTYTYQAWINYKGKITYRVEIGEDLLATGRINSKKAEEYITIIKENGLYKLNINKYIAHEELNKTVEKSNIKITALSKDVYIDEVKYNLKIENFSQNNIILDTRENNKTIILTNSNGLEYSAEILELLEEDLVIYKQNLKNISIRFRKTYQPEVAEIKITFKAINLNYEGTKNKTSLEIDLKNQ